MRSRTPSSSCWSLSGSRRPVRRAEGEAPGLGPASFTKFLYLTVLALEPVTAYGIE
ncbi:hypothetical protein ACICHK_43550 (plasmid) [Streptomyces sp. AHU1]|uniref:hypothetical protein n=1 Tax=Streptomyces sp. AHU1 TaxID=3377215 RepID=UPI003877D521